MSACDPTSPALVADVDHSGNAEVQVCLKTMTEGMAGLILADVAASYVRDNPATPEDRARYDAYLKRSGRA